MVAGAAVGIAGGAKPPNFLFLAGGVIAYIACRRPREVLVFGAAIVPSLVTLLVWKSRGLGTVPLFSLGESHAAIGAGTRIVAAQVDFSRYLTFDWHAWSQNMSNLREFFYSARLAQWAPIAGAIVIVRWRPGVAALLVGWLAAFLVVKGASPLASIEGNTFFRLLMPAWPAYLLLIAAVPLLVPTVMGRLGHRVVPAAAGRALGSKPAVAVLLLVALVPLLVVTVARPARSPESVVLSDDGGNTILIPVDRTIAVSATTRGATTVLAWSTSGWRAGVSYRVMRSAAGRPDVACTRAGVTSCLLTMRTITETRDRRYVDVAPPAGGATYRIGVMADYRNPPTGGDHVRGQPTGAQRLVRGAHIVASVVGAGVATCSILAVIAASRAADTMSSPLSPPGGWKQAFVVGTIAAFALYCIGIYLLRRSGGTFGIVATIAVIVQLSALIGPTLLSRDVNAYWAYARVATVHDGNPYADLPGAHPDDPAVARMGSSWLQTPSLYGPVFTAGSELVAVSVRSSPKAANRAFRAVAAASMLAILGLVAALGRNRAFAVAFVGWNPLLAFHMAGGGHNDALMMALSLAALFLARRKRPATAGVFWALAIGVKWVAAGFVGLVLLASHLRDRRLIAGLAAGSVAIGLGATALYGTHWIHAANGLSSQAKRTRIARTRRLARRRRPRPPGIARRDRRRDAHRRSMARRPGMARAATARSRRCARRIASGLAEPVVRRLGSGARRAGGGRNGPDPRRRALSPRAPRRDTALARGTSPARASPRLRREAHCGERGGSEGRVRAPRVPRTATGRRAA